MKNESFIKKKSRKNVLLFLYVTTFSQEYATEFFLQVWHNYFHWFIVLIHFGDFIVI